MVVTCRYSTSCCTGDFALSCIGNRVCLRNTRDIYRLRESIAGLCQEGQQSQWCCVCLPCHFVVIHLRLCSSFTCATWMHVDQRTDPTTHWLCNCISVTEFWHHWLGERKSMLDLLVCALLSWQTWFSSCRYYCGCCCYYITSELFRVA